MPYSQRSHLWILLVLALALVASGCGPARGPQPSPTQPAAAGTGTFSPSPPATTARPTPPAPPTQTAYPWPPTRTPEPTFDNRLSTTSLAAVEPIPTRIPPPIVLGTFIAPPAEMEQYVSTTVVVAAVGSGPGEIGYQPPVSCGDCCPGAVIATLFAVNSQGDVYIHDQANLHLVQFDRAGNLVRSIAYGETIRWVTLLAANSHGQVCLYEENVQRVECFDAAGHLAAEFPRPSWLTWSSGLAALAVDEAGTVWVQGTGPRPGAPEVGYSPYPYVTVPLGDLGKVFTEEWQRNLAVPGQLLPSGQTGMFSNKQDSSYLHNRAGFPIYEWRAKEQLLDIDHEGSLYTLEAMGYNANTGIGDFYRVRKYTAAGLMVASFDIVTTGEESPRFLAYEGTLYRFTFDRETLATYRVVRWEKEAR